MQRLEVSGAVRPIYGSLGFKRLSNSCLRENCYWLQPESQSFSNVTFLYKCNLSVQISLIPVRILESWRFAMIDGLTFVVSYITYIIGTWSWASFIDTVYNNIF